jgi:predicted CXXCH cytochrome family protein
MKRLFTALITAVLCVSVASRSDADIANSAHDFTGNLWSGGQICNPCHTPHRAVTTVSNAPLWNHALTSMSNYTLYSSATLNATPGQPDGISKLCLSCHDGTIAIDSFGGNTGTSFIGGNLRIGTDLRGNHPISITYDTALAAEDTALNDPSGAASGVGSTIDQDLLFAGKLECASCHDVHNSGGHESLLRIANEGSRLCLTCHNK